MTPTILIPISQFQHGFTTCPAIDVSNVELVTLDDKELGVHKVSNRTPHPIVQPPEQTAGISKSVPSSLPVPTSSWLAHYPKGSINPSASLPGGFGFYANGPSKFSAALADATETVMSYRMMLDKDWDGNKGGKLPGIYGGVGALAYGCTGGRKENRCSCFNIRLMWRENSVGELYVYMPPTENNRIQLLSVPPLSVGNAEYGFSVGRGSFNFTPGAWMSVSIGIKLNDLGVENGKIELWIDGCSVISVSGLTFRDKENGEARIQGMHFQTFFGGHTEEWASPKDQDAWFADVTGVIVD